MSLNRNNPLTSLPLIAALVLAVTLYFGLSAPPSSKAVPTTKPAAAVTNSAIAQMTQDNFAEIVTSLKLPAFVWMCGPETCTVEEPVINKLAKEYEGKVVFYKMDPKYGGDAGEIPEFAQLVAIAYGMAEPTHVMIVGSNVFASISPDLVNSHDKLKQFIDEALNPATTTANSSGVKI
jgi:hypothetical protein